MGKNARVRSNRIVFTLNNYTEEEALSIIEKLSAKENVNYAIIGFEVGKQGTPHLQGYIHHEEKPKNCGIKYWREQYGELSKAHMENAKGSDQDSHEYCSKEGDFWEIGVPQQTHLGPYERIIEASKKGLDEIAEQDAEFFCKSFFQARAMVEHFKQRAGPGRLDCELRQWQKDVLQMLDAQSQRQVLFVVDEQGGKGKTFLADYLSRNLDAFRIRGGKHADLAHMWAKADRTSDYVAIDLTRTLNPEYWPYQFIEDLKDGFMISTKYNSVSISFDWKKVVVFTNSHPDMSKLSMDRYQIHTL